MRLREDFDNNKDFFDWYIPKIKEFVPNLEALVKTDKHAKISKKLPKISKDYVLWMFKRIREIFPIPPYVKLVYSANYHTWASRYNSQRKRLEILVPPYGQYQVYYPPIIIAAIQHELGHILNRDFAVTAEGKDQNGVNICMDCRINADIDRQMLDDLTNATYKFYYVKTDNIVPETFYPKINMPYNGRVHGWRQIYQFYIAHKKSLPTDPTKEPKPKPNTYFEQPKVGDIVQVSKGEQEGDLGLVLDVDEKGRCTILPMTVEEVDEYFAEQGSGYSGLK